MYEAKLQKIMEAYEHMNEYPKRFHDSIRVKNITWDEDDVEENPELEDVSVEDMDVEYIAEYEGDHRGRTDEIEKQFREFYGCVPYDYDTELLDAEVLESVSFDDAFSIPAETDPEEIERQKFNSPDYVIDSDEEDESPTGDGKIHVFDGGEDYPYVDRYVVLMPDGVAFFIAHDGGVATYGDEMWDYTFKNEMEQVFDDREEVETFTPFIKRGIDLIVSKYYEDDEPELAAKIRGMIR